MKLIKLLGSTRLRLVTISRFREDNPIGSTFAARIDVDGIPLGETPLAGLPLLPGPHVIRATLPDGRILERTVEVSPDSRHFSFGP